ncbi:MAG: ATP-dependent RecD-like DNA helicase [Desulfosalsimonas sp.]|uniref:SF1B family DNA helicase RecD2 n=1 Tax=Desulfosalsimonas sp. TaxID=3073848 RepID=UPI003970693F
MMELQGRIRRITFHSTDTHYTVAQMEAGPDHAGVTIVGHLPGAAPGQAVKILGKWVTHPRYGEQFAFQQAQITRPSGVDGIRQYLGSGLIKGIGPGLAESIIEAFGTKALDILDHQPERLREISGIGETRAVDIGRQWQQHRIIGDIMDFLQQHGIEAAYAGKIFRQYGVEAMEVLTRDPFRLAEDLPGQGFMIADAIAGKADLQPDPEVRAAACIEHLLYQSASSGHMFYPEDTLFRKLEQTFGIDHQAAGLGLEQLSAAGKVCMEAGNAVLDQSDDRCRHIYLSLLHEAETGIAMRLSAMMSSCPDPALSNSIDPAEQMEDRFAVRLSDEQKQALEGVLASPVSVITGGPGTGKTTLVQCIAAIFKSAGLRVCLAAPTGRAARRLTEITGKNAHTIHKLLGYHFETGCFDKSRDDPVEADVLIVDEASMIDAELMYHLVCATRFNARLILVGDVFQLPPVGPGNVLADIIESGRIPVHFLTEIFRQAARSAIVRNAHNIRRGRTPEPENMDANSSGQEFCILEANTPQEAAKAIVDLATRTLPDIYGLVPGRDIQVVSPVHKGAAGTISLNQKLQKTLNPGRKGIKALDHEFCVNDRVMHLKNNYAKDVFNGDIGIITGTEPIDPVLRVDYDGRQVSYGADELDELSLGYAITVHKSQGSEYPAVILPVITRHYVMLQRNLLYTAITRARHLVVLVGNAKAIGVALKNDKPARRLSNLAAHLHACGP